MEFQIEARRTWDIRNTRCRGCNGQAISANILAKGGGVVAPPSLNLNHYLLDLWLTVDL